MFSKLLLITKVSFPSAKPGASPYKKAFLEPTLIISSPSPATTELLPPVIVIKSSPSPASIWLPRLEPIIMSSLFVAIMFLIPAIYYIRLDPSV